MPPPFSTEWDYRELRVSEVTVGQTVRFEQAFAGVVVSIETAPPFVLAVVEVDPESKVVAEPGPFVVYLVDDLSEAYGEARADLRTPKPPVGARFMRPADGSRWIVAGSRYYLCHQPGSVYQVGARHTLADIAPLTVEP